MADDDKKRAAIVAFRVTEDERRELALLASAKGVTRSELLRRLVRREARETAEAGGESDGR